MRQYFILPKVFNYFGSNNNHITNYCFYLQIGSGRANKQNKKDELTFIKY